jgi:hypothetical protein
MRANKHSVKLSLGRLTRANKQTINSHVSLAEVRYVRWDSKSEVGRPTKHTLNISPIALAGVASVAAGEEFSRAFLAFSYSSGGKL